MNESKLCPCCSGKNFTDCCGPYLNGDAIPPTAEATMRSRYVAYVNQDNEYLLKTWHESTRPTDEPPATDDTVQWTGLNIIMTEDGGEHDSRGVVEFRAKCKVNGESSGLDEASDFVKEDGRWFYVDGRGISPIKSEKIGRNNPCPCGSGKKYKKCCGKT
jgi:SEC-C motif domain protein